MRKGESQNVQPASYYARSVSRREQQNEAEFQLGYLLASIEQSIHAYAEKTNYAYSVAHTAFRVSQILSSKALRQEPGLAQLLQQVRPNGATALLGAGDQPEQPEFVAEEAVHVRPRIGRPLGSKNGYKGHKTLSMMTQEEKRAHWREMSQRWRDRKKAGLTRKFSPKALANIREAQHRRWQNRVETGPAFEQQRARALAAKRTLTPKQIAAMRRNAIKARAAQRAKYAVKKRPPMSAERRAAISKMMKAAYARKRAAKAAEQGGQQAS